MTECARTASSARGEAEENLASLKADMARLASEVAAERDRTAAMEAAARAERARTDRMREHACRLLQEREADENAAIARIAALEARLAAARQEEEQLRIACDGYIAQIEELTGKGWLGLWPLLRRSGTKLRFAGVPGLKGLLDRVDGEGIGGWACWPERPTERVKLAFYDGERFLGVRTADRMRQDLVKKGIGDGRVAFFLPLPQTLADGKPHRLDVRLAATAQSVLACPIEVTTLPAPGKGLDRRESRLTLPRRLAAPCEHHFDVSSNAEISTTGHKCTPEKCRVAPRRKLARMHQKVIPVHL